jgi:hypothetical protein
MDETFLLLATSNNTSCLILSYYVDRTNGRSQVFLRLASREVEVDTTLTTYSILTR